MSKTRSGLALLFRFIRIIGIITYFLGGMAMVGWYIGWLDEYFLWRVPADIIGVITCPLTPLVVIIEWIWHGWPSNITRIFLISQLGALLAIVGGIAESLLLKKSAFRDGL